MIKEDDILYQRLKELKQFLLDVDHILLIFLLLFTNQAVITVKVLGLVLVYLLRPNLKFGLTKGRMPLFYLAIIALSVINLFFHVKDFEKNYLIAFAVGNMYWLAGFLAYHQIKLSVERSGGHKIHNTLKLYTLINLGFCLWQLVKIMLITHTINPYAPNIPFPYGISTGDKIFGVIMESCYFNIMVSAMLSIYFLFQKNFTYVLVNILCLLLSFGNMGTMIFLTALGLIFFFSLFRPWIKSKAAPAFNQWYGQITVPRGIMVIIPILFLYLITFYLIVSVDNIKYVVEKITQKTSTIQIQKRSVYDSTAAYINDAVAKKGIMNDSVLLKKKETMTLESVRAFEGKKLSFKETISYLKSSPIAFVLGAGTGRFSSLSAARFALLDSSRLFTKYLPYYSSHLYYYNHRLIHAMRMKGDPKYYATINWPDSFYNQLFGEYGILGVLIFLMFYVGYFVKRIKYWSYSMWLCVLISAFAFISYMFEALCVMVFFELLMETDVLSNKLRIKNAS